MKKNLLLSLAALWFKICMGILVLFFCTLTWILLSHHVGTSPLEGKTINLSTLYGQGAVNYSVQEVFHVSGEADPSPFTLEKIKPFSLHLMYVQFSTVLFFSFLVLKEAIKITDSVKKLNSFKEGNVHSFRKMGKYFLVIVLLSGFAWVIADNAQFRGLFFNLEAFSLMAACYIMAEIFKEGSALQEEIQSTV